MKTYEQKSFKSKFPTSARVGASLKLNAVQKRDNDSSSSDSNANVVSLPFVL